MERGIRWESILLEGVNWTGMTNYSMNTIVRPGAPYERFWECCELNELQWSEKGFVTLKEGVYQ